jgi:hypothetical protein
MTNCLRPTRTTKQLKTILYSCLVVLGVFSYNIANAKLTFTKILDNKVADPIGGNFNPDSSSPPAIEGTHIVFRNISTGGPEQRFELSGDCSSQTYRRRQSLGLALRLRQRSQGSAEGQTVGRRYEPVEKGRDP